MPEFKITKQQALTGRYILLPESKNISIKNLRINLITDEINLTLFEETRIELLKSDGNLAGGGLINEYENHGNVFTSTSNETSLPSNKHGYYCLFDSNMVELINIDFAINFQYN